MNWVNLQRPILTQGMDLDNHAQGILSKWNQIIAEQLSLQKFIPFTSDFSKLVFLFFDFAQKDISFQNTKWICKGQFLLKAY